MKGLSEIRREYTVDTAEEWQILGRELTEYFGQSSYWVCWKFPLGKIKSKYLEMKKDGDSEFRNFIQKLRND